MAKTIKHDLPQYIIGIICFVIGLTLVIFALYVLPHLLFAWRYPMPLFIEQLKSWLFLHYGLNTLGQALAILVPMLILGGMFLFLSALFSNYIEAIELAEEEARIREIEKETGEPEVLGLTELERLGVSEEANANVKPTLPPYNYSPTQPTRIKYKIHPMILYLSYVVIALLLLFLAEWLIITEFTS